MDPILFIRKEVADLARREYDPIIIVYEYGNTVISSILYLINYASYMSSINYVLKNKDNKPMMNDKNAVVLFFVYTTILHEIEIKNNTRPS